MKGRDERELRDSILSHDVRDGEGSEDGLVGGVIKKSGHVSSDTGLLRTSVMWCLGHTFTGFTDGEADGEDTDSSQGEDKGNQASANAQKFKSLRVASWLDQSKQEHQGSKRNRNNRGNLQNESDDINLVSLSPWKM